MQDTVAVEHVSKCPQRWVVSARVRPSAVLRLFSFGLQLSLVLAQQPLHLRLHSLKAHPHTDLSVGTLQAALRQQTKFTDRAGARSKASLTPTVRQCESGIYTSDKPQTGSNVSKHRSHVLADLCALAELKTSLKAGVHIIWVQGTTSM